MCLYIFTSIHLHMCTFVDMYTYIFCMYACVCMFLHIHINTYVYRIDVQHGDDPISI